MPADAIRKQRKPRLSSTARRLETVSFIQLFGIVMPVRCSRCKRLDLECKVASKSESCGSCVASNNSSCNIHGNDPSELRKVLAEKRRLDDEERATLSKLLRLKDQQRSLAARADELFGHEIEIMQEEDRQLRLSPQATAGGPDAPEVSFSWESFLAGGVSPGVGGS